ncbi:AT-rich interactive domain-containing protein 2-like [Tropilaelaps mercedesae]|uniref:AT-rich interactive domain-containing protein 2-like n=1 Tax=Tropilaelaps mercedesae TaxID=418985 RepID=A0A1V9X701_9ACAR|nr:AT-rich interactive domain-containing protein 2-like [Tropilaelaps mercedesae]
MALLNERPERWYEITHALRFPDKCPNGTLVLRQIYQRYLGTYEKVTFLGEDPDLEVEDSGEVTSSSFRGGRNSSRGGGASANAFVIQVPMSYNRQQHEVTDGQRANYGLSTQLAAPASPFERLCFSLQSGMPNEETFALNVCTLLANGGRHAMQLNKAPPRLVDLLVSQAGLTADDPTLRETLTESWRTCEARRMTRFWQEHVDPAVGLCLGLPPLDRFVEAAEKIVEERDCIELISEGGFMATREALEDEDDLFNLDNEVSPRDAEAQRVLRIALILHNLSFEEANAQILAQNQSFLRMMMLGAVSRWASLRQVGLDCLANVAPHLQLNVHDDIICRSLLRLTIDGILKSQDRGLVTRCLDIITHLAQCENNQQTLVAELDSSLLERLLELLTVHDVLLIIHSLETLYALTELGDGVCERLVAVRHAIGMLVSMLSLDPIAYGAGAQRGMKIVEHFDPLLPPASAPLIPPTLVAHHGHTQLMPAVVQATHMAPPAAPVQPHIVRPMGQPNGGVAPGAQPPVGATPPSHAAAPSTPAGSGDAGSVGETEALATAWIRAHIELTPGASVGRQELYADYVNFCSKAGRRSVLSGHHFSTCIRTIFPQSTLKVTQVTGPNQQLNQVFQYDNLRRRAVPLTVAIAQPAGGTTQVVSSSVVSQLSATAMSTPSPSHSQASVSTPPKQLVDPPHSVVGVVSLGTSRPAESADQAGGAKAGAIPSPVSASSVIVPPVSAATGSTLASANASNPAKSAGPAEASAPVGGVSGNSILKAQLSAPRQCAQPSPVNAPQPTEENANIAVQSTTTSAAASSGVGQGSSNLIKSLLASKVSRNLQKQAALGSARAALPEGAQAPPTPAQRAAATPATPVVPTAARGEDVPGVGTSTGTHLNGVADKNTASESLPGRGVEPEDAATTKPTPGTGAPAMLKTNGNHEAAASNPKIYKSSPLLNGLLDRGTPNQSVQRGAAAVNGNGAVDVSASTNNGTVVPSLESRLALPNGEAPGLSGTAAIEVRKRRLTFGSEDSNKQDAGQEKQPGGLANSPNSTLSKLLHNGTADDSNSGNAISGNMNATAATTTGGHGGAIVTNNNNTDAKRMKLMQDQERDPAHPSVKLHTNGDLKTSECGTSAASGSVAVQMPTTGTVASGASNNLAVGGVVVVTKDSIVSPAREAGLVGHPKSAPQRQGDVIDRTKPVQDGAAKPLQVTTANAESVVQPQLPPTIDLRKEEPRLAPPPAPATPVVEKRVLRYHCEWKGCDQSFVSARHVLLHAVYAHVGLRGGLRSGAQAPPGGVDSARESLFCQWGVSGDKESCDGMARRRLSLCTHVQERHCSDAHLHVQAIRRQQISQFGAASLPAPAQPPPHPGYAADAAAHAIRRHAASFHAYRDAADEREHPVTRSVRLTAALILRNLARHVPSCRSRLAQYESRLSQVAMSALESSRTVAQCLADLHVQQDLASKVDEYTGDKSWGTLRNHEPLRPAVCAQNQLTKTQ